MTTVTVRQRGQLTIPEEIREQVAWLKEGSVVAVDIKEDNKVELIPYDRHKQQTNWKRLWQMIRLARSIKGPRGNLSQFIAEDRFRH